MGYRTELVEYTEEEIKDGDGASDIYYCKEDVDRVLDEIENILNTKITEINKEYEGLHEEITSKFSDLSTDLY